MAVPGLSFGLSIKNYIDAKEARRDDGHVLFAEMQHRYDELCIQLNKEERQLSAATTFKFSEATTSLAAAARESAVKCLASGKVRPKYLRLGAWVATFHCVKVMHLGDDGLAFTAALVAWVEQLVREEQVQCQLKYIRYSDTHNLLSDEAQAVIDAWSNTGIFCRSNMRRREKKCKAAEDAVDAVRESIAILRNLFDTEQIGEETAESVLKLHKKLVEAHFGRSEDLSHLHAMLLKADERQLLPGLVPVNIDFSMQHRNIIGSLLTLAGVRFNHYAPEKSRHWPTLCRSVQELSGDAKSYSYQLYDEPKNVFLPTNEVRAWKELFEHTPKEGMRGNSRILIEGDVASGKTTFSHSIAVHQQYDLLRCYFAAVFLIQRSDFEPDLYGLLQLIQRLIFKRVNQLEDVDWNKFQDVLPEAKLAAILRDSLIVMDGFFDQFRSDEMAAEIYQDVCGSLNATLLVTCRTGNGWKLKQSWSTLQIPHKIFNLYSADFTEQWQRAQLLNKHFDGTICFWRHNHAFIHSALSEMVEYSTGDDHWEIFEVLTVFLKKLHLHYLKKGYSKIVTKDNLLTLCQEVGKLVLKASYPDDPTINEMPGCENIEDILIDGGKIGLINCNTWLGINNFRVASKMLSAFCMATCLSHGMVARTNLMNLFPVINEMEKYFLSAMDETVGQEILEWHCSRSLTYKRRIPWLYNVDRLTVTAEMAKCWIDDDGWMEFASSLNQMDCKFIEKVLAVTATETQGAETILLRHILFTDEISSFDKDDFPSIVSLRVVYCGFSHRGSKYFSLLMRQLCRKLHTVLLHTFGDWICEPSEWFANFHDFDSLVELDLGGTALPKDGFVEKLANSLNYASTSPRFPQLKHLNLANCGITADTHLFTWLSHCQQLNVLSLQGVHIAESNGGELCKVLFQLKYLQVLNMLDCSLPDSFIDAFVQIDQATLSLTRFLFGKEKSDKTNCRMDFWKTLCSSEIVQIICVKGLERTLQLESIVKDGLEKNIMLIDIDGNLTYFTDGCIFS